MRVLKDLISAVKKTQNDCIIQNVAIGVHWTAVTSSGTGLAATLNDASCCYAQDIPGVGHLQERTSHQLTDLLFSAMPLERSLGMAALNSLTKVDEDQGMTRNAKDLLLERCMGKKVAIIGHFPFAEALREKATSLWVLELEPAADEFPSTAAPDLIPQADIIGLTATTLMNGTFDALHELFPSHALVVMMGPSTPLSPVLFDYGIDILAGSIVTDARKLYPYIHQASTLHHVEGLRRFTLAKEIV